MHIFSKIWNFQTTKLVTLRATHKESKNFDRVDQEKISKMMHYLTFE